MPGPDNIALLREYAETSSESAFAGLVEKYVNLVYSTALRSVGNAHAAEEITQAVFIILAKKARGLSRGTNLSGWLYQTTRLTAANFLRTEIRRQHREQEAYMQSLLNGPEPEVWLQIAPLLDTAMERLGEKDRNAIVMRFFENKSLSEVGRALGASEDAAKMRVNRTLEKLRKICTKRGVTLSATLIAGAVSANSVQAAPVGLAATVTATAVKGATISATLTTLVKGTMKTMTWLKIKFAATLGGAALLVGGVATVAVSQTSSADKLAAQEIAKQSQAVYAALSSYSDNGKAVSEGGGQTTETTFNIRMQRPNLYRIDWTSTGGSYVSKGIVWSDGSGDYFLMDAADKIETAKEQKMHNMQFALGAAGGVSGSASSMIPGIFFSKDGGGDVLRIAAIGRTKLTKLADQNVGGVDCHVVSSVLDPATLPGGGKLPNNTGTIGMTTTMLWIGKKDHLIHQTQTTLEGASISMKITDENLKTILERQNKPATPEALAALRSEMDKSMALAQNARFVFTQTHENISVNKEFSPSDFAR